MIYINSPKVDDCAILRNFKTQNSKLAPFRSVLAERYSVYILNDGDPGKVHPIKIGDDEKNLLLKEYEVGYARAVNDKHMMNWIYDLRHGVQLPYCPMCGNTGRDALDHYLPKEDYPEFAVFSRNLVPTCTACNGKRNRYANAPGVLLPLLHPYMDGKKINEPLISVKIDANLAADGTISYMIPKFSVIPCLPENDSLFARLKNHIEKCVCTNHFERWITGRWGMWRIKAPDYSSLVELTAAVMIELKAEIKVGGANNWTAAFLRGLHADPIALEWMRINPEPV